MYLLYSLLYTLAFLVLLPYFAYQAVFNRKYLGNFSGRLWLKSPWSKNESRPAIWLHAVSVGETLAAKPLITALRERFPDHRLVVSTTTLTGQAVALENIREADLICYFPFDWKFTVRHALNVVQPKIVLLMESELWLNFLHECSIRQIPTVIVNGRISDRSFPRSQKFGLFVRWLYGLVTCFLMQSRVDAERAVKLGAASERVFVCGNLKYDIEFADESPKLVEVANQLEKVLALSSSPLIVAGSTSEGEEKILFEAFSQLRKFSRFEETRLLVAPRHPERFGAVARLVEDSGFNLSRRSSFKKSDKKSEIILLDSVGELAALYRFASLVFVGGSLVPIGGHNILEPAFFAKPIVVGPHMQNFRQITEEFLRRDAVIQIQQTDSQEQTTNLSQIFAELLDDKTRARQLGENARQAIGENRGATVRTVSAVADLLSADKCPRSLKNQSLNG
ncbi:MAG: 3-deoxy-D-manno-octulosonic acid transferase [Blastocatellales bacterium]